MDHETELQLAQAEVHKAIGRNLLMFQRAEYILKALLALGSYSTSKNKHATNLDELVSEYRKHTLGQIATRFIGKHCTIQEPFTDESDDENEASLSFSFTLGGSEESSKTRKAAFDKLVEARNHLVHHLFAELDQTSIESCSQLTDRLKQQRNTHLPEINRLAEDFKWVQSLMLSAMQISCLQQEPLIQGLANIAEDATDNEKWVSLRSAFEQINASRAEVKEVFTKYGKKSPTELILASQLFEIKSKDTTSDHAPVFYRIKDAYHQS